MTRFSISAVWGGLLATAFLLGSCSGGDGNPYRTPPGGFDSGDIDPNGTFSRTFPDADTIGYHCVHHGMPAAIRVHPGAAGSTASVSILAGPRRFSPDTVAVRPGGTITWTNLTTENHTVTSN